MPEDNVLEDGTLIDLSGAILLWRSGDSLSKNLTHEELAYMILGAKSHFTLYHSDPRDFSDRHGAAIALSQQANRALLAWEPVNERMAFVRLKGHFKNISIVSGWAGMAGLDLVTPLLAVLGLVLDVKMVSLLNFADQNRLIAMSTSFQHRNKHLLTCYSNDGHMASQIDYILVSILNQTHVQCPVLYRTLRFDNHFLDPSTKSPLHSTDVSGGSNLTCATFGNRQPFVYLNCGHVHGWHPWRHRNDPNDRSADRTCPLCRQASRFVPLTFGEEVAFYVDHGPPTHCFNPCGHIASEATVRYWCSLKLPSPKSPEMRPRCPFCGTAVKPVPVRLILQHNADEDTLLAAFSAFDPSLYPTPPLSSSPDTVPPTSMASMSSVGAQLNCPD
ncbi:unnamed protein product [Schistocephalus solidus]|uniref:Uncharacterized protein n=1 Tax=Schistocephalus solidus TaxID=70667 RepID=A0A3P7ESJ2_SCHSO|nr:unnamed protein product [Schistocephalus solidus]